MTSAQVIKHTLISIAIGAAVSILTVLFQEAVSWLHHIQPEVPGAVVGMGKYLHKAFTDRIG